MHLPFSPGGVPPQEGSEEAEEAKARKKTRTPLGINLQDEEPGVMQKKTRVNVNAV